MDTGTLQIIRLIYSVYAIILIVLCVRDFIKLCNGGDAKEWVCGNCGRPVGKNDSKCPRCKNELHPKEKRKKVFIKSAWVITFNVIFIAIMLMIMGSLGEQVLFKD